MSNIFFAVAFLICIVQMPTDANVLNIDFDEQMGNPMEWNEIQRQLKNNGEAIMYIPVSTKSQQMYTKPHMNENAITKPNRVTINRLPKQLLHRQSAHMVKPSSEPFYTPRQTYSQQPYDMRQQYQTKTQQHQPKPQQLSQPQQQPKPQQKQPTINRGSLGSPSPADFGEYLLHAQMPLPNVKTFVLSNIKDDTDPEFMT